MAAKIIVLTLIDFVYALGNQDYCLHPLQISEQQTKSCTCFLNSFPGSVRNTEISYFELQIFFSKCS